MKHLPLDEYRERVGKHLELIEAGTAMAARHARALDRRPAYETLAEDALCQVEKTLAAALENVRAAKAVYASKPVEELHAMHAL